MGPLSQLFLRSTLLCGFIFSCYGSSIPDKDAITICKPENCCEIHWNREGSKERTLFVSFLSVGGHTLNCSLHSSDDKFDDIGIPIYECTCVSKSGNLLTFSNFTRICRATVFFQEMQSEANGSNGTMAVNCTAKEGENVFNVSDGGFTLCNESRFNHTSQVKCLFSFKSFTSTGSDVKFILQVVDYNNTNASEETIFMKIAALLILGVLFVLLLLIIIGLCMICQLKVNLRSQSNSSRILPKMPIDEGSIATYASVKCPRRQVLTGYNEVNILPSVSEVDETEVFEAVDVKDLVSEEKEIVNDQDNIANEASVDVPANGNEESAKAKTVPHAKKPSVVYAFIKKAKST